MATLAAAAHLSGGTNRRSSGGDFNLKLRKGWFKRLLKSPVVLCRSFNGFQTPIFVPASQPIELFFFQRIFDKLCEKQTIRQKNQGLDPRSTASGTGAGSGFIQQTHEDENERTGSIHGDITHPMKSARTLDFENGGTYYDPDIEVTSVPLMQFHRAMSRLFRVLRMSGSQSIEDIDNIAKCNPASSGHVGWFEFCSFWKEHEIAVHLTLPERVFLTLEDSERSICGRIMSVIVFITILISTACFILSTVPSYQIKCTLEGEPGHDPSCVPETSDFFKNTDLACVAFFSIEYGCRLLLSGVMRLELVDKDRQQLLEWMVTEDILRMPNFTRRVYNWACSPANLIDLAAIMPWYLSKIFESGGGGDSLIIRLIRLTRVIRAIRLGKRFEAVIIVARSVQRSIRALYVLVLNLVLGVTVFASLMYFCEQGTWDKTRKAYLRVEGQTFNEATKQWEDVLGRSPFDSIPGCFWWAIVTATTVGYGDIFPTTPPGKVIAGITMAWSLCVLALPIGVIGANFSNVWAEFDEEKKRERWNAIKEDMMVKRSIAWGDPLHYSRCILLEVWHDPGLSRSPDEPQTDEPGFEDDTQAEFMGEVNFKIETPPHETITRKHTMALTSNYEKSRRKVRGLVTFEYTWRPMPELCGPDSLLTGFLEVVVLSGEDLISIDWKGSCSSDPYVVVVGYPKSPQSDGEIEPEFHKSQTMWDPVEPVRWDFKAEFQVHWTRAGTESCMAYDMKQIGESSGSGEKSEDIKGSDFSLTARSSMRASMKKTSSSIKDEGGIGGQLSNGHVPTQNAVELTETQREQLMARMVPELQEDIMKLTSFAVPKIKSEINMVHDNLEEICLALAGHGFGNGTVPGLHNSRSQQDSHPDLNGHPFGSEAGSSQPCRDYGDSDNSHFTHESSITFREREASFLPIACRKLDSIDQGNFHRD